MSDERTRTSPSAQTVYEAAATMRRSHANLLSEMNEFKIASTEPRDVAAMERARSGAHAYLDAYLDALSAATVTK